MGSKDRHPTDETQNDYWNSYSIFLWFQKNSPARVVSFNPQPAFHISQRSLGYHSWHYVLCSPWEGSGDKKLYKNIGDQFLFSFFIFLFFKNICFVLLLNNLKLGKFTCRNMSKFWKFLWGDGLERLLWMLPLCTLPLALEQLHIHPSLENRNMAKVPKWVKLGRVWVEWLCYRPVHTSPTFFQQFSCFPSDIIP